MGYATLEQVKAYVAAGYGDCNADKLTGVVNTIRQHFFNWYQEVALFMDAVECFCLQTFPENCNDCSAFYTGITLPRSYANVEAMWWNDWPVRLNSSWREFQTGLTPECDCRLEKYDMPGTFPTAADIDPRRPQRLILRALDARDIGKPFTIRGIAVTGQRVMETVNLHTDNQVTGHQFVSIDRDGITKPITHGGVILTEESSRPLGIYDPTETLPAYRRIKITGAGNGNSVVNIRGSRRYFPLHYDWEVVETDNQVAFDAMARYLRIYERSSRDNNDLRNEQAYYATAVKMMTGEKARDKGRGATTEVVVKTPQGWGRGLNRVRRCRW